MNIIVYGISIHNHNERCTKLLKFFAERNNWKDIPNVDKFDHLHEELIEMSQHLRYKSEEERKKIITEKNHVFKDGIGDLFFALCRLSNQLGVDIEDAFNTVKKEILSNTTIQILKTTLSGNKRT